MTDQNLNTIKVMNNRTEKNEIATYRRLGIEDLQALKDMEMKNQLYNQSTELCVDFSLEEFKRSLDPQYGVVFAAYSGEKMIAFYIIVKPPEDENLGIDIGLDLEERKFLLHGELTHVLPAYRGNGLMRFLFRECLRDALSTWNDCRYICTTIYPFNIPSLKSTMDESFFIVSLKEKYGGVLRYILLRRPDQEVKVLSDKEILVELKDLDLQRQYFDQGFVGSALIQNDKIQFVQFEKAEWRV
jgi:GNAT superfamily N-acetyltransferase